MPRHLALAATLFIVCGCSSPSGGATGTTATPPRATPARTGGAPLAQERPFAQVSADARQTGRPILIYFWTSW